MMPVTFSDQAVAALERAMWECPPLFIGSYGEEDGGKNGPAQEDAKTILRELASYGYALIRVEAE